MSNQQQLIRMAILRMCRHGDFPSYENVIAHMYYFYRIKNVLDQCDVLRDLQTSPHSFWTHVETYRNEIETQMAIHITDTGYKQDTCAEALRL